MVEDLREKPGRVAVIDDNAFLRVFLRDAVAEDGHDVDAFEDAEAFLAVPGYEQYEVVVTDIVMEGMGGLALIEKLRRAHPQIEIIVVTMRDDADTAVRAMRGGAFDYLTKPADPEVLRLTVARGIEKRRLLDQNRRLQRNLDLTLAAQRLLSSESADNIARESLDALLKHLRMEVGAVSAGSNAISIRNLDVEEAEKLLAAVDDCEVGEVCVVGADRIGDIGTGIATVLGEGDARLVACLAKPRVEVTGDQEEILAEASFLVHHAQHALENVRRYARARDAATRDALTGLYNAHYFEEALRYGLASCAYNNTPLAVLFIDIDHFKAINDVHGHLIGSRLLVELARVLERCIRTGDEAARYGGDEFVILLQQCGPDGAKSVSERIRTTVERHRFLYREGKKIQLTVCVGAACYPDHAKDAKALCELADAAMYRGKAARRNAVHLAPPPLSAESSEQV